MAQPTDETPAQPAPEMTASRHASAGLAGFMAHLGEHPELMVPSKRVLGPCYLEMGRGPRGGLVLQIHHIAGQEMILVGLDQDTLERLHVEGQERRVDAANLAEMRQAINEAEREATPPRKGL